MAALPLPFPSRLPQENPILMSSKHIVHIVDDDEAVRKAICLLLKSEGIATREYASAIQFLDEYDALDDCCLVADVRMPGLSGLELQEELIKRGITIPVIIMTGHGDIGMAVKAMKAGATDFIEKPFKNQVLLDRIRDCLEKAVHLKKLQQQRMEASDRLALLTEREREVMDHLVAGKLNKQIAAELNISTRTVEAHRARVMDKLQAKSLSDIIRIAFQV